MRVPVDTSRLKFLVVAEAEPLRQFEEGKPREAWAPRTDANGEVLWRVQLVTLGEGEAEIIRVAVPGDPKVAQGEMVAVDGLTAQAWELPDGRSGMSFRARAIRSAAGARGGRRRRRRRDGVRVASGFLSNPEPAAGTIARSRQRRATTCAWLQLGADGELGALRRARRDAPPGGEAVLAAADRARAARRRDNHPGRPSARGSPASMRRGWRAVMAIDDLLDRARDARRRRDEAAGELVALVRALEGLEGVGMLDGTQRRELGRLRDRPRAKHNAPSREAPGGGAGVTAMRTGRRPRRRLAGAAAGMVGGAVALARRARAARAGAARVASTRLPLGAAAVVLRGGLGVRAAVLACARARAAGADAAGAAAAAPLPARLDRRRAAARCARAAAARCRPARSPRSASRRGGRSRIWKRAASGWRPRSGCASCASRATPPTRRAAQ